MCFKCGMLCTFVYMPLQLELKHGYVVEDGIRVGNMTKYHVVILFYDTQHVSEYITLKISKPEQLFNLNI